MFLKDLLDVTQILLKHNLPKALWEMDVSTIRYYDRMGLLSKAEKVGRNNEYDADHVRQLIILKVLQSQGKSLSEISEEIKSIQSSPMNFAHWMKFHGIEDRAIQEAIEQNKKQKHISQKGEEHEMITHETKQIWSKTRDHRTLACSVTVSDYDRLEKFKVRENVKVGSTFAFVDTEDEEFAKEIYKLMHGQKKQGKINRASFYVNDELELPGIKVKNVVHNSSVGAVVADKDVYQEGSVARIFAFIPQAKKRELQLNIYLQNALIDQRKIKLDENGCILFRVPVLVSGSYRVSIVDDKDYFYCDFESSKYQLVPFTVSAETSKTATLMKTTLTVEKYGAKCSFPAKVWLQVSYRKIAEKDVSFVMGNCEVDWDMSIIPSGQISIVVQDKNDRKLTASTPLTGSQLHERQDTEVSSLGKVISCSMMSCPSALSNRGLYFTENETNNCPVVLTSCVSKTIDLKFNETASDICLVTYDPLTKKIQQHDFKEKKAGSKLSIKFDSEHTVFHLGCFFDNQPWEGHGFVTRPSEGNYSIEVPKSIEPSQTLKIKIKVEKPTSVLLKVCDKRLRSIYDPISKMASSMKSYLDVFKYMQVGVANPPVINFDTGIMKGVQPAVYGSPVNNNWQVIYNSLISEIQQRGYGHVIPQHVSYLASQNSYVPSNSAELNMGTRGSSIGYWGVDQPSVGGQGLVGPQGPRGLGGYSGMSGCSGISGFSGMASAPEGVSGTGSSSSRKSTQDSLYCELISVTKEKTIEIKIPDVIGVFDVKAFFVSGLDWIETCSDVRVEKPLYIEPLIPQFVHADDDVYCRAIVINSAPNPWKECGFHVKVSGKIVKHDETLVGSNYHLRWKAVPGSHEIIANSDGHSDRVIRVVESPSEETVLTQEIRIIKPKKTYSIFDEDAISIAVLPGIEEELKRTITVCIDYQHACCEQTSASIAGAALSIITGDDGSKEKGIRSLISGDARLKQLFNGSAFRYYPHDGVRYWANHVVCQRLMRIDEMLSKQKLPEDAVTSLASIKKMVDVAMRYNAVSADDGYKAKLEKSPMERIYIGGGKEKVDLATTAKKFLDKELAGVDVMEACYCVASLVKTGKQIDLAIDLVNKISKSSQGLSGWFGTELAMAYMSMVHELVRAKILSTDGNPKVTVDEKEVSLKDAIKLQNITSVKASHSAVLLRVNRLTKLSYEDFKGKLPMSIKLNKEQGLRAGDLMTLTVTLSGGYHAGDVLLVMLPDCLSRMIGGVQSKKFELDFAGNNAVMVDLVVHDKTTKPQKWGAVVRNMYDSSRIGCAGLMSVSVSE